MSEDTPFPEVDVTETAVGAARMLVPGALLAGRYRIVEMVGIGGMGMVYRAHDEELDLEVAVKLLRAERTEDEDLRERFRRELILARQVSHRNVVRIHDIGSDGSLWFLTMDFVAGRSLRQKLDDDGSLPAAEVFELAAQLVAGLAAAHREGVVHRDLKPGNVLLDEAGRVYVTDFGIARSLAVGGLTVTGQVLGTPDYLAPEQVRGEEVDHRADLFACGLILFEAATGKLPFSGGTLTEVMAQRLSGRPRRAAELGVELPAELQAIIDRCLERDPDDRYQDADALLGDLHEVAAGGDAPLRRRRLRRALRSLAWGGTVVVAVAVVAAIWAWWPPAAPTGDRPAAAGLGGAIHSLAVLPLVDQTGRADLAWISTGVAEMVAGELAESSELRVVDSDRVADTLEDLGLDPRGLADGDLALLAQLLDADRLLTGSVRAAGERVRVDGQLLSYEPVREGATGAGASTGGRTASARAVRTERLSAETDAEAGLFGLATALAAELRSRLGIAAPATAAAAGNEPTAAAVRDWSLGVAALRRGEPQAALAHFEEAVVAAPGFLPAWDALASLQAHEGRLEAAAAASDSALAALLQGSEESLIALRIRSRQAALSGDPDTAREILEQAIGEYPHDHALRLQLAQALADAGRYDAALETLAEVTRHDPLHPQAWYLQGRYAILAGDPLRARNDFLVRALVVNKRLGDRRGEADALNAMGAAAQQLGKLDEAEGSYRQAGELRRDAGDVRGYSATLTNLAYLQSMRGDHAAAVVSLEEALALGEELGDRAGIASLHNHLGFVEEQRGRYREALAEFRRARELFIQLGDRSGLADSEHNVGFAHFVLGEYDAAHSHLETALRLFRETGQLDGAIYATQSVGQVEMVRGRWQAALGSFLQALEASRELKLPQPEAISQANLGRVAQYQGRYAAALASYGEALTGLAAIGDPRGLAEYTLFEADALAELGLLDAAEERLAQVAGWLEEADNREQRSELARVQGMVALARQRPEEAAAAFERAADQAATSGSRVAELAAELGLGAAELAAGEPDSARSRLAPVATAAAELGHVPLQLAAATVLASAHQQAGDPASATRAAREALSTVERIGSWAGAYRLHLRLADSLEARGSAVEARAERARAHTQVERLRDGLDADRREAFDRLPEVVRIEREARPEAA